MDAKTTERPTRLSPEEFDAALKEIHDKLDSIPEDAPPMTVGDWMRLLLGVLLPGIYLVGLVAWPGRLNLGLLAVALAIAVGLHLHHAFAGLRPRLRARSGGG
jgi:hypothetical protein